MSPSRSLRGILVLLALVALLAIGPAARVAADGLEDTSIRLIPADAAFYGTMLRNREQIKIIAESNAWKKLTEMPAVQMGRGMLEAKMEDEDDPQFAQAKAMMENPQVKDLLGLLADMFSDDVFCYGDSDVAEVLELAQDVGNAVNYGPLYFMAAGEADAMRPEEMQGKAALYALADNADKIKIPTTVMGFSVEDEDRAKIHLGKLEGFLGLLTLMQPQFAGRVVREKVGDDEFLTLKLDGEMIPWDEVPLDDLRELEANEGDVDKIVDKVRGLEMVIAFGVREGYLMVAVTDSLDKLAQMGSGDSLLARPELAVVHKHGDQRLTGLSYVSEDFVSRMALSAEDIDGLLMIGDTALKQLPLDDSQKERIRGDVDALASDLKKLIPKTGATVGFSFLTEKGVESYNYNWTENKMLDGSQPLEMLRHIGGDPLLAVVWREHVYPEAYERMVHWLRVGHGYFEEFALPEMSDRERGQYEKVAELVKPLLDDLDEVTRECLIPACSGQSALVLDAKLMTKRLPPPLLGDEEAMPLPEPAIVVGIKDADAMREAYVGYQKFFNDLLDVFRELDESGDIPDDYEIPWPEVSETSDTSTLTYTLPPELGVDEQIEPNAVLTEDVAVVTATKEHSKRLLESTAPAAGGVLADADRPRAVAFVFNWPGTVDALTPWLRLAAREAAKENLGGGNDDPQVQAVVSQVETVLEVLKAIRHCTAECYFEDGALVTHSFMEVQDIE